MNEEIFELVCVPLLGVDGTRMLAISTPDGSGNYYSLLFNKKKEDGSRLCKTITIGLSCDECQKNGRSADCTHLLYLLPSWKSKEGHELQRSLVKSSVFQQEAGGEILNTNRYAFVREDIDAMFARPRLTVTDKKGIVWIAVDPSGGGHKSECALIAAVIDHNRNLVVCQHCLSTTRPTTACAECARTQRASVRCNNTPTGCIYRYEGNRRRENGGNARAIDHSAQYRMQETTNSRTFLYSGFSAVFGVVRRYTPMGFMCNNAMSLA